MRPIASKLLCGNIQNCIYNIIRNGSGSIKDAGGKWAEMQAAHEGEYFYKKNKEFLDHIKDELKKGRKIEDIIEETKEELRRRQRAREAHDDDDHHDQYH